MRQLPLTDATQQYAHFRELAKKLCAVPKKKLEEKFEEVKGRQQKKQDAVSLLGHY